MFERFTDRARRVVVLAQTAAGDAPMLPRHLFLGIVQEGGSLAARTLTDAGVTKDEVFLRVAREPGDASPGEMRIGDPAIQVLEQARVLSERMDHSFTTPEHLLLALLDDPAGEIDELLAVGSSGREALASEVRSGISTLPTGGDPRSSAMGNRCEKCGASISEHGKVKDLRLGIEDREDAIDLHAYFCGECGSAYGLVKD